MKNNLYIDGVHYLTAREAGDVLGYAPDYVSRLCREGKLRGRRSGKTWIVEADSLVPFIKAHEAKKEAWHQNLSRELKSVAEPVVVRDENFQPLSPVHVAPRQLHILRASEKAHAAREKAQTMLITRITISSICAVLLLFIANTTALSTPIANMLRGSAAEQVAAASFFSPIESIARASYTSITSIACSITGWCDDVQPMPVVYVRGGSQPVAQAPAPTQITNNITNYIQPTVGSGGVLASGLSEQLLDSRLNAMENYLTGRIELAEYRGDRQAESIVDSFPDGIGGAGFDDIDITDSTFTGGSISGASISGSTLSGITFSGTQAFDGLEVTDATSTNATSTNMYVSGSFGFGTGTGLLQTSDGIASTLTNGSNGQVLKMVSGNLTWSTDLTGGGGGGASFFASTTDDLAIYPADPTDVVIIGSSATTTVGTILEIAGNSLFRGAMTSYGNVTAPRFTATSTNASVFPYASTTALSTNSLCIAGDCRQAWPTFTDTSFSTTSADYWKTQRDFFSTTSASYFLSQNQGTAFSTTSADYLLSTYNKGFFFSTTSAQYFLTQNGSLGFSTTSNDYWMTQRNFFSTTSADAWKDQRNFFSTSSASYFASIGLAFSTTSNDYWKSVNNFFSTTSADYWGSTKGYATFSYLFPSNATSTRLDFNAGLTAYASSTIGGGTRTNGLTISGGATTTGTAYFAGNVGIGTSSPVSPLSVVYSDSSFNRGITVRNTNTGTQAISGIRLQDSNGTDKGIFDYLASNYQNAAIANTVLFGSVDNTKLGFIGGTGSGNPDIYFQSGANNAPTLYIQGSSQNVGIGTTSPYGKLSVVGNVVAARFVATTSTASVFPYASTTALSAATLCLTGDSCISAWPTFTDTSFSTTSADYWKTQRDFFSTTSASYFLSQNQGNAFSSTSAAYFLTQNGSLGFSTTSNDYWKSVNNFFSTSSADYWQTTKDFFSTTSASYFLSQNQSLGFSTTSANYFAHSSTTIPKTYTANAFTALQTFGNASSSIFSANTICLSTDCRTSWPTAGSSFEYPFFGTGNSTSTLVQFNGGLTAYASSTIGNGSAAGGLTVNGTATTSRLVVSGIGTSTFAGDILMGGSIIPSADNTYSLGSESRMWKDVYIGPGSLYVNGKKVIEDVSNTITISTDNDQNLMSETSGVGNNTMRATGSGNMNLLSASGNINVTSTAGNINIGTSGSGQLNLGIIASGTWQGTAIADAYLTKSGNWTGTLDGYEAAQLLGSGFSTTSADYWKDQRNFFSTSSADYWGSTKGYVTFGYLFPGNATTTNLDFQNGLTISSGSLGIGTSSPGALMDLGDAVSSSKLLLYNTGSNQYGFGINPGELNVFAGTGGSINFRTGGAAGTSNLLIKSDGDLIMDTSGSVGIGTNDPSLGATVDSKLTIIQSPDATALAAATSTAAKGFALNVGPNGGLSIFDGGINGTSWTRGLTQVGGKVGIGTTNPFAALSLGNDITQQKLAIFDGGTGGSFYGFGLRSARLDFQTEGTTRLTIDNTGNVGIGALDPITPLDMHLGSDVNFRVRDNGGTEIYAANDANSAYTPLTIQGTTLLINPATEGSVGIGTSSPTSKLSVYGNILLEGSNRTINFGTIGGDYGLRDNAGSLEFKNLSGSWNALVSSINHLSDAKYDGSSLFLGDYSGNSDDGSNSNTGIGTNALFSNTSGQNNTALGFVPLYNNLTGSDNIALGYQPLYNNTSGSQNIGIGRQALLNNDDGGSNIGIGTSALSANVSGTANITVGGSAMSNYVGGNYNTALGYFAGRGATGASGNDNVFIGASSGESMTSGGSNVFLGTRAGDGVSSGNYNIAIGAGVGIPDLTSSGQLNIGSVLFGTGLWDQAGTTSAATASGRIGIGSTTPGSILSIGTTNGINFSTATSTFSSTGGINLTDGCYAIDGVCISGGSSGASFAYPFPNNATTTTLAFNGGLLAVGSTTINGNATTTGMLGIGSLFFNGEQFLDFTGAGLLNSGGFLTLDTSGNWSGTFDGLEGSAYLANSFSTTSANYWQTQRNFFSTTSADYWETQQTSRLADNLNDNILEDLSNVAVMTENLGDLFYWNGSQWSNIATSSLGLPTFSELTGYSTFGYLFPSNATSTLLSFNGGVTAYASSTIGAGGQATGLTINGGATTTGVLNVTGTGTSTISGNLDVVGALKVGNNSLYLTSTSIQNLTGNLLLQQGSGNVGIGTTTPQWQFTIASTTGAQLSLSAGAGINQWAFRNAGGDLFFSTTTIAGTATTSTAALSIAGSGFGTTTVRGLNINGQATSTSNVGFNITAGCYAMNGVCLSAGSTSLTGTQGQVAYFSGTNTAVGTSSLFIASNGNVGVGTTSPTGPGSAGANLKIARTTNNWGMVIEGVGSNQSDLLFHTPGNTADRRILQLVNNQDKFTIRSLTDAIGVSQNLFVGDLSTGHVGIGTTTPNARLTVYGDTLFNGTDRYANFGTTTGSSGYGFRDNAGVIEFKNLGGTWQGVTTATTGPSFHVSKTVDQTNVGASPTLITWDVENFDTNNNFSGNRFTPTVPGKYILTANLQYAALNADDHGFTMIYKNGVAAANAILPSETAEASTVNVVITTIVEANGTTDYFEVYGDTQTVSNETVGGGNTAITYFTGTMIAPVNGNNAAGWANDGTQSFLLDNADKVGVGTSTPWAKLAIQGDSGQLNPVFEVASSSTATKFLSVSSTGFGTTTLSGLNISGSATSTSNVGMNITSGCYAVGGVCISGTSSLSGTQGQIAYFSGVNTAVGTSSLFIATSGNIGIGTSTPSSNLEVQSNSAQFAGPALNIGESTHPTSVRATMSFGANTAFTQGWVFGQDRTGLGARNMYLYDVANSRDVMLWDSTGNVGIGTTTPSAKLTVFGDTLMNGTDRYLNFGTTTGSSGYGFRDNGGVIEFKNANGTWQGVTTATTGPSFSVHKNGSDQTVVADTFTLITWGTELFDTNNNFASNRFTPTVPGKYMISSGIRCNATVACVASIYKNGSELHRGTVIGAASAAQTSVVTATVDMNGAGDYVEIYAYNDNGTSIEGDATLSYFTGTMIAPINGNNAAGWANDGSASFLLDNADNLGIGTTSPAWKLAVVGSGSFDGFARASFFIATSTTASTFSYASTTAITSSTASTTNLVVSGLQNGLLKVGADGAVSLAVLGTDYQKFAYLFPSNATSTLLAFNGGLTAYASSTIGAGSQTTGLTINGGATTTGNAYFGGNVGIGTTSPGSVLSIGSIANFQAGTSTLYQNLNVQGQLKVGTNSIYLNGSGTSTFSNGIDLAGGCFSILNTCVLSANTSGLVAGDLTTAINTSVNALQIASSSAKWVSLSNGVADSFGSASIADDSGIDLVNSSGIATSAGMIALVPDAAPSGGSSSSSGGDSIRTFTSNGTFYSGAVGTVQVLVVGGGGGGGGNATASVRGSGGGGAGEYVAISSFNVTPATSYAITVGTGGGSNTDGATTTAFGLTARGGGAGAEPFNNGRPGGSGGGAGDDSSATTGGASTAVSPGVGSSGGNAGSGGSGGGGAGGGGAAGAGGSGGGNGVEAGGAGGTGIANTISGTSVTYSSGGAGGTRSGNNNGTNGATPGSGGRGAGGGASTVVTGGTGADGIVIVRYTTVSGTGASRLISNTFTASSSPSTAKFFFAGTSTAAFTLNTHIAAAVSRDGGTTWSTTTLQALSTLEDGSTLYGDTAVDLSGQPSGTSMKYRILMSPSSPAGIMLRGVSLQWGEVSAQNAGALSVTGSLSAQSLSLTSALGVANGGTGLTSISSGSILFGNDTGSIGTSSSLFWDTTNQRLGIGTTTPTYMLSVSGNGTNAKNRIAVWGRQNTTNGTAAGLSFFNTDGNPSTQKEIAGIDAGRHSNNFGGSLSLFTSDTAGATSTRLFIDSSGNVGIGTTTPLRQLHVSGTNAYVRLDGSANSGMEIYESGARKWIIDNLVSDDRLRFFSDTANEIMSLTQSGNVGVGTTTPVSTLSVQGSLCVRSTGSCGTTAGTIYATTATISDIDLAENYRAIDSTLLTGEIVSLLENSTSTIRRAKHGEEGLGVLSTKPGLLLGQEIKDGRAVALKGRVPLKVNMEGGPIAVGDRLTISSVPGIGTKATTSSYTVARALEATSVSGEIEVFVENEYTLVIEEKNALRDLLNATSTATSTPVFANIFARMTNWLADAQNGITEIFTKTLRAENVYADTVNANKLCLEDLCVTKAELQQLLNQSGATPASTPEEPPDEPQSETPPEETGSEEPAPEPEDSPETEAPEDAPEESETPPNDENPEPESTPEPSPEEV